MAKVAKIAPNSIRLSMATSIEEVDQCHQCAVRSLSGSLFFPVVFLILRSGFSYNCEGRPIIDLQF